MTAPRQPPLVAVAASAGGVEALKCLVRALPPDLDATVLVGLHLPLTARSMLPSILQREAAIEVVAAEDGQPLQPGRVLVAPPDAHLLVLDDRVVLGHGPRENGHRPSHDAMLRAVALARGPRAVGVVLTGMLDDGAAGLVAVRRYGGRCLVQDPDAAEFPAMPRAALLAVPDALRAPLDDLSGLVVRAVTEPPGPEVPVDEDQLALDRAELESARSGTPVLPSGEPLGSPSTFSCPDCHGVLNLVPDDRVLRFRCRTGHAWTSQSLASQQEEQVEEALWIALRVLEERADLSNRLAEQAHAQERSFSAAMFRRRAEEADRSVRALRAVLESELTSVERSEAADQG